MKQIGIWTACACLCAAVVAHAQNVAVVDMEELIRQHPNTASDKKLLDSTVKDFRGDNDDLRQKLETLQENFEKIRKEAQDPALSDKARKAAEERAIKARDELLTADRTAREKMQSRQEQLSEMQSRMLKKTIGEIREVVGKYAEDKKIQLVLPAGQVVFSEKTLDITEAILKQLNIPSPVKDGKVKDEAAKPALAPVKDAAPVTPK